MSSLTIITMPWLKKERKKMNNLHGQRFPYTTLRDVCQLHKRYLQAQKIRLIIPRWLKFQETLRQ